MNIELTEISSGYNLSKINQNFSVLKNAVNTLLLHVDGTNELKADLDFNGFKALNLKGLVIDGRDIIEVIDEAYKEIDSFLQTTDNLLREIEAILSGQLQDRNQGNGQYSTQLTEAIEEGTTYTIPNGLQYIVGRNSLRISYQGVMCYPTYQYDEVGTFDEPSNKIKFNVTIPAYSQLNIWISGVGNIVQIKEDLEAAFAEYTEYVTNTKNEIDTIKESIDSSEANVTAIEASVKDSVVNLEQWNTESVEAASNSKIWAEGTDEEITPIGGTHSSKTWSLLAKEYAEAAEQIKQQIGTPLNVQGRVDDIQSLPSTGNKNGDMYFVGPESSDDLSEYVWINNKWEFLGVLGVTIPDASESEKGIVKLATQDEISARTGNSVVTASKLPTNIDWSKVDNKPSTLSGYEITDVYNKTEVDTKINEKDSLPAQEGNSGKFLTTDGTSAKWENISGLVFGSTLFSLIPLTEAGLHLLDGSLLSVGGVYDEAITKIAELKTSNPNLFVTEETWQQQVATYGVCGKFVYTEGVSLRLPKITGFVEGTLDATALGNLMEAGLPNIVGSTNAVMYSGMPEETANAGCTGAFVGSTRWLDNLTLSGQSNPSGVVINFNASNYNHIYGNSETVQPQSIKGYLYIVIATSAKTDVQVDIDNIATDLNEKAGTDLANINNAGKNVIANMAMPSGKYVDLSLPSNGQNITVPADGYVYMDITARVIGEYVGVFSDYLGCSECATMAGQELRAYLPVKNGTSVYVSYTASGAQNAFRFIYVEGSKP